MAFAWPVGIGYIFFVVGALLNLMTGFQSIHTMLFILNLVIVTFLFVWPLMLGLAVGSILVATGAFYIYQGSLPLDKISNISQLNVIYSIPIFISLVIAIIKKR